MNKTAFVCIAATTLLAGYACTSKDTSAPTVQAGPGTDAVGSLRFDLEIAPGVNVDTVGYQVTAADIPTPITGSIPLGDRPGTRFTAVLDGIPVGTGRLLSVQGTASDGSVCTGQATFDVLAEATAQVVVVLECRDRSQRVIVHGSFDRCPLVSALSVAPDSAPVGGRIFVGAATRDPEGREVVLSWSATAGTFADPHALQTTYTCTTPGTQTLTATVTKADGSCSDSFGLDVTCTGGADAGAGGAGGSDGGAGTGGSGGTAT
ncbi:MAG TPA: hypothetical protein VHE30_28840, partial [Polyangiaceae bacterium]|nr:hypothetical protein [Polyangiaceae bacterium]